MPSEAEQGSLGGGELLGCPLAPGLPACLVLGVPPADPPKVISVYLVAALPAVLTNPSLGASLLPPWLAVGGAAGPQCQAQALQGRCPLAVGLGSLGWVMELREVAPGSSPEDLWWRAPAWRRPGLRLLATCNFMASQSPGRRAPGCPYCLTQAQPLLKGLSSQMSPERDPERSVVAGRAWH